MFAIPRESGFFGSFLCLGGRERQGEKKNEKVSLECQKGKERYLSNIENCLFILINKVGGVAQ